MHQFSPRLWCDKGCRCNWRAWRYSCASCVIRSCLSGTGVAFVSLGVPQQRGGPCLFCVAYLCMLTEHRMWYWQLHTCKYWRTHWAHVMCILHSGEVFCWELPNKVLVLSHAQFGLHIDQIGQHVDLLAEPKTAQYWAFNYFLPRWTVCKFACLFYSSPAYFILSAIA